MFQKGQVVELKNPAVPKGPVVGFRVDQESGSMSYLVEWIDAAGETQQRWFTEAELKAS